MKPWIVFVVCTVLCWGAYVPTLHNGQKALGENSALRAFLFVGLAYLLVALLVLGYVMVMGSEPWEFTRRGIGLSTLAGVLGALGALGIVFALKQGGRPVTVAPLVFAGAPIVNTLISMAWHKPAKPPSLMFYLGIVMAAVGAAITLKFKPH
ncbi:MAG: hypothetical protein ACYTHJ_20470 [Planctomycetota bacterium]|jgi:drug/metabolite transporter (DMT)-like permease